MLQAAHGRSGVSLADLPEPPEPLPGKSGRSLAALQSHDNPGDCCRLEGGTGAHRSQEDARRAHARRSGRVSACRAPGKPCRSPTPQLTEPLPSPYGRASPNAGIHSEMRRWAACSLCGPRRHSPQHPRLRVHTVLHVALTDPGIISSPDGTCNPCCASVSETACAWTPGPHGSPFWPVFPSPRSQPHPVSPADPGRTLSVALTNDGVVALGEAGDELVRVGLPGSRVHLFVRGSQLPKTDVLHDCRSKQDWLLGDRGEATGNVLTLPQAPEGCQERPFWPNQDPRRAGKDRSATGQTRGGETQRATRAPGRAPGSLPALEGRARRGVRCGFLLPWAGPAG